MVLSFFLYPLIFLPVTDAMDNMDSRLEEAAESLGATRSHTLRAITLPLILPPVFSGSLLVFISAFVIFGPVALLGGPVGFQTIPTAMLQLMTFPPKIEYAAVLGLPVLVALGGLLVLQRRIYGRRRYTTVGGKPGQRRRLRLGLWRWPAWLFGVAVMLVSVVLPFGVLLLTSFRKAIGLPLGPRNLVLLDNYRALLHQPEILESFWNSLWISLVATVASIAVAVLAVWLLERGRWRLRGLIQPSMLAPLAFPGAILGIAMIITYGGQPFWIGGTLTIIVLAYLIRVVPQSFTYTHAGLKQVNAETEDAARSLGASWTETMRRVTVPLLRGPILSIGVLNFVLLFRELDVSIFLYTGTNSVAPVVLYNLASESRFQLMGALSVVMLTVNLGVVLLARRLLGVRIGH
jgi:iron(III) transport system permease protein